MEYLHVDNLSYCYPSKQEKALKNIDFVLNKGEILFIAGESGSGKSTLGKCISGSAPNFYGGTVWGDVKINGDSIGKMDNSIRAATITMVFQDPERQLVMNKVHREIAFGLENVGVPQHEIKRRVWEALQFSNLLEIAFRDISTLSGGQKQKVAITSALSYLPEIIILDEPTSQLDPASSEEVISLIEKINKELGITIIVIEQRINRWFEIADRICLLSDGKLDFYGTSEGFYKNANENMYNFLPSYVKLCKGVGIDEMPDSFKTARIELQKYKFNNLTNSEKLEESSTDKVLCIKNLSCGYEGKNVINDMNIDINRGDFWGILGANGAGKSTLLKSIMGIINNYKGSIKVFENEVKKTKIRDLASYVGYLSQNPNDYISKETVYEELKFTLDNFKISNDNLIDETLKSLNIYRYKFSNPRDLSGGERQRVALASILVMKPRILLLDEPTRGLDYEMKKQLGQLLKNMQRQGITILMVTHDIEFSAAFCKKFLLMFNGEIASCGLREEVLKGGIYYTTPINKLLRSTNIFTVEEALSCYEKN